MTINCLKGRKKAIMTFEGTIRVDILDEERDRKLMDTYLSHYDKYIVSFEIAEKTKKPHWQGVIFHDDEKAFNAAKARFTKIFKATHKGGTQRSMAIVQKPTYKIYICKQEKVEWSEGFSETELDELKSQWIPPVDDNKKITFTERVVQEFELTYPDMVDSFLELDNSELSKLQLSDVIDFVLSRLGSEYKAFGDKTVIETTNAILIRYWPHIRLGHVWRDKLKNRVIEHFLK